MAYSYGNGPLSQSILRTLADGTPRTARQLANAINAQRVSVHTALRKMQGQPYRHPALIAVHTEPPASAQIVWTITGAGRLAIQRKGAA